MLETACAAIGGTLLPLNNHKDRPNDFNLLVILPFMVSTIKQRGISTMPAFDTLRYSVNSID
jgi:hypothetical protein